MGECTKGTVLCYGVIMFVGVMLLLAGTMILVKRGRDYTCKVSGKLLFYFKKAQCTLFDGHNEFSFTKESVKANKAMLSKQAVISSIFSDTVVLGLGIGCVFLGMLVTLRFSIPVLVLAFICPEDEEESKEVGLIHIVIAVFLLPQLNVSKRVGFIHIVTTVFLRSQRKASKQVGLINIVIAVFLCLVEESKQVGLINIVVAVFLCLVEESKQVGLINTVVAVFLCLVRSVGLIHIVTDVFLWH